MQGQQMQGQGRGMRWISRIAVAILCAALQACVTYAPAAPAPQMATAIAEQRPPVTILVSIDGFRPDYLQRGVTPNLNALAAAGVSTAMRPSFPSITFPNHYTLITGLRPDRSGVVGNKMEDVRRPGEVFTMESDASFWWEEAEPLWITAEKAGIRSATMFWPGANVDHHGHLVVALLAELFDERLQQLRRQIVHTIVGIVLKHVEGDRFAGTG